MPPDPRAAGTGDRYVCSCVLPYVLRETLNPQTCDRPGPYRSVLNGTTDSTVQPFSNRATRESQTPFHSATYCRSFADWPSARPPIALVAKNTPLRWSWNVSKMKPRLSLPLKI